MVYIMSSIHKDEVKNEDIFIGSIIEIKKISSQNISENCTRDCSNDSGDDGDSSQESCGDCTHD